MKVLVITFEDEIGRLKSSVIWLEDVSTKEIDAKIGFILDTMKDSGFNFSWSIQEIENNA